MIIELLFLINSLRTNPLTLDNNLSNIATERAEVVYTNWSHDNWYKSFRNTDCSYIGENLAKNFTSPTKLLTAQIYSPKHKENLVSTNYSKIGIGVYKNVVVELFCGY